MTDRLMIAYGLMFLVALALGAVVWWSIHHSHRRTYERRLARERKKAEEARRQPATAGKAPL